MYAKISYAAIDVLYVEGVCDGGAVLGQLYGGVLRQPSIDVSRGAGVCRLATLKARRVRHAAVLTSPPAAADGIATAQDLDERLTKRRVEHGVDDGVHERRDVAEPRERREDVGRPERALRAEAADDVEHEEWRPQHDEDAEDDAEHLGGLALVADGLARQQALLAAHVVVEHAQAAAWLHLEELPAGGLATAAAAAAAGGGALLVAFASSCPVALRSVTAPLYSWNHQLRNVFLGRQCVADDDWSVAAAAVGADVGREAGLFQ